MAPVEDAASRTVAGIRAALPNVRAVAVVDTLGGQCLASFGTTATFDPARAAAQQARLLRHSLRAMLDIPLSEGTLTDMLFVVGDEYHVLRLVHGGTRFLYLVVGSQDTNLALARTVAYEHGGDAELLAATSS